MNMPNVLTSTAWRLKTPVYKLGSVPFFRDIINFDEIDKENKNKGKIKE